MVTKYFEEINDGNMDINFLLRLDAARGLAGIPFVISSAYRDPIHNEAVGGKPDSSHLLGLAVDIKVSNSRDRFLIVQALISVGFNRIGIGKNFIHVDSDPNKAPNVIWHYYED